MHRLYRIGFIITFLALGLWGMTDMSVMSVAAQTVNQSAEEELPIWDPGAWSDEENFQACATLIGEGELCGWPQHDPDKFENEPQGNSGSNQSGGQTIEGAPAPGECPIESGEGVLCTGPTELEVPDATPEEEPVADGTGTFSPDDCTLPIGEGVIGCGPDSPSEPQETEAPVGGQEISVIRLFAPALSNQP